MGILIKDNTVVPTSGPNKEVSSDHLFQQYLIELETRGEKAPLKVRVGSWNTMAQCFDKKTSKEKKKHPFPITNNPWDKLETPTKPLESKLEETSYFERKEGQVDSILAELAEGGELSLDFLALQEWDFFYADPLEREKDLYIKEAWEKDHPGWTPADDERAAKLKKKFLEGLEKLGYGCLATSNGGEGPREISYKEKVKVKEKNEKGDEVDKDIQVDKKAIGPVRAKKDLVNIYKKSRYAPIGQGYGVFGTDEGPKLPVKEPSHCYKAMAYDFKPLDEKGMPITGPDGKEKILTFVVGHCDYSERLKEKKAAFEEAQRKAGKETLYMADWNSKPGFTAET